MIEWYNLFLWVMILVAIFNQTNLTTLHSTRSKSMHRWLNRKGPHPRQRFQSQPRCAARSRLRLLSMVYPHTQRPICSIFFSSLIVTMSDLAPDDQIAHQISENSDQQQPQQRPASHGGGCGCWSPYTGNLVEVAVGNRVCDWRSLSWMGPFNEAVCLTLSHSIQRSRVGWRPCRHRWVWWWCGPCSCGTRRAISI